MDWEPFYSAFRRKDFIPGYEIENRLGGGAFGEVYKARKHSIGKAYAIGDGPAKLIASMTGTKMALRGREDIQE